MEPKVPEDIYKSHLEPNSKFVNPPVSPGPLTSTACFIVPAFLQSFTDGVGRSHLITTISCKVPQLNTEGHPVYTPTPLQVQAQCTG